jgi:hypothetical protein
MAMSMSEFENLQMRCLDMRTPVDPAFVEWKSVIPVIGTRSDGFAAPCGTVYSRGILMSAYSTCGLTME